MALCGMAPMVRQRVLALRVMALSLVALMRVCPPMPEELHDSEKRDASEKPAGRPPE